MGIYNEIFNNYKTNSKKLINIIDSINKDNFSETYIELIRFAHKNHLFNGICYYVFKCLDGTEYNDKRIAIFEDQIKLTIGIDKMYISSTIISASTDIKILNNDKEYFCMNFISMITSQYIANKTYIDKILNSVDYESIEKFKSTSKYSLEKRIVLFNGIVQKLENVTN